MNIPVVFGDSKPHTYPRHLSSAEFQDTCSEANMEIRPYPVQRKYRVPGEVLHTDLQLEQGVQIVRYRPFPPSYRHPPWDYEVTTQRT